jgi:hypothetical protein
MMATSAQALPSQPLQAQRALMASSAPTPCTMLQPTPRFLVQLATGPLWQPQTTPHGSQHVSCAWQASTVLQLLAMQESWTAHEVTTALQALSMPLSTLAQSAPTTPTLAPPL